MRRFVVAVMLVTCVGAGLLLSQKESKTNSKTMNGMHPGMQMTGQDSMEVQMQNADRSKKTASMENKPAGMRPENTMTTRIEDKKTMNGNQQEMARDNSGSMMREDKNKMDRKVDNADQSAAN